MAQFSQKDLVHIKGSETLLATIESIKKSIRDLGCKAETPREGSADDYFELEDGNITFSVKVSFSLPAGES